jgi:protein-histidine N-methyltransferase
MISYSPLFVPLASSHGLPLARRDLFDARFQLLSGSSGTEDDGEEGTYGDLPTKEAEEVTNETLRFLDAPSDLVRGVYEGGLKTWECSLDLAGYLHSQLDDRLRSDSALRVLEAKSLPGLSQCEYRSQEKKIGCGTAVPSATLLGELCRRRSSGAHLLNAEVHVQDYNRDVLSLVALPNLILAWCNSFEGAVLVSKS